MRKNGGFDIGNSEEFLHIFCQSLSTLDMLSNSILHFRQVLVPFCSIILILPPSLVFGPRRGQLILDFEPV